jgi:hypothetical protein
MALQLYLRLFQLLHCQFLDNVLEPEQSTLVHSSYSSSSTISRLKVYNKAF